MCGASVWIGRQTLMRQTIGANRMFHAMIEDVFELVGIACFIAAVLIWVSVL
jgi:hypothetical protein